MTGTGSAALFDMTKGGYVARQALDAADLHAVLALRGKCFGPGCSAADAHDQNAAQVLVCDAATGAPVCCYRVRMLTATSLKTSYAAQFYDLKALAHFEGSMLEIGRFCIAPHAPDADILRLAWAVLTRFVDHHRVGLLFGCSSFPGESPLDHLDAFALLQARHIAPTALRPGIKAAEVYQFANLPPAKPDLRRAQAGMPPLLRSYLTMGGWVSDHAVIDRELGTLHVFTGLETAKIPESRKRLLRALA